MITSFRGPNKFLSNMFETPVTYGGLTYPSAENAFQAQKCFNPAHYTKSTRELMMHTFTDVTPKQAKKMGRQVAMSIDFDQKKYLIMREIIDAKFSVDIPEGMRLCDKLLQTSPQTLVEANTWHDNFWGICICDKCTAMRKSRINSQGNALGELLQRKRNLIMGGNCNVFTMYLGRIYNRLTQKQIEEPTEIMDITTHEIMFVGDREQAETYYELGGNKNNLCIMPIMSVAKGEEDYLDYANACEHMNRAVLGMYGGRRAQS